MRKAQTKYPPYLVTAIALETLKPAVRVFGPFTTLEEAERVAATYLKVGVLVDGWRLTPVKLMRRNLVTVKEGTA